MAWAICVWNRTIQRVSTGDRDAIEPVVRFAVAGRAGRSIGSGGDRPLSRATVPRTLRLRVLGVALSYTVAIALVYGLFSAMTADADGRFGALVASAVAAVEVVLCWRWLGYNHHPDGGALSSTLGSANALTLARGGFIALAAGFLVARPGDTLAWAPAVLCGLAGLADYFDGALARFEGRETELGAALDLEFDGFATFVAAALCVRYGLVPPWYLAVGFARYAFVAGKAWRRHRGEPLVDLPDRPVRTRLYALQFTFSTVVLAPPVGPPLAIPAALVALAYVAGFARDWLVVSGRLPARE